MLKHIKKYNEIIRQFTAIITLYYHNKFLCILLSQQMFILQQI